MCKLLYFFFTWSMVCCSLSITAQQWHIKWHAHDTVGTGVEIPLNDKFDQSSAAVKEMRKLVPFLQQQGYLAASVDSVTLVDSIYHLWYFTGPKFQSGLINLKKLPLEIVHNRVVDTTSWEQHAWDGKRLAVLNKSIVRWYENNGYPFASTQLKNVQMGTHGLIHAELVVDKGKERRLDSIQFLGNADADRVYLLKYLGLQQGEKYNEEKLRQLSVRIAELQHLQEFKPWEIIFESYSTRLNIYLNEKRANQLNALVGLQPNTQVTGKFLLTIDAQFAFRNLLSYGEQISFSFQNLQYRSPRMTLEAFWPYLLGSDIGIDAAFELYRNDLLFRKSAYKGGLRYQLNAHNYLRLFYQNQSNRLLQVDTFLLRQSFQLPSNADFQSNGVGLETALQQTDFRLNPRKGWQVGLTLAGLKREVLANEEVLRLSRSGENFQQLYDSANVSPYQLSALASMAAYLPLGQSLTLKTAYQGGYLLGRQYFRNELFQVGGSRLLRGFDEQSLFVHHYQIITAELRLYTGANSFLQLFSDNGYLESDFQGSQVKGFHYGLGGGIVVENKTGLFQVTYALGGAPYNPMQFRQSKIHFGYLAFF